MNPEEKKKFKSLVSEHNKHWDEAHKYFNKAYNESETNSPTN